MLNATSNVQFGEFTLNLRSRELRRQDAVLPLPAKAFDLLSYMVSNPGRPLSKTELLEAVWPDTVVEESNLSQTVFLLRKVLGSAEHGPIKTLPGHGYQFAAEVTEREPPAAAPVAPTTSIAVEATQTRMVVRHDIEERISWSVPWARTVVAVLLIALAGVAGRVGWQYRQDRTGGAPLQVVLAPMDGTTGDPILDKTLTQVLRMDLAQSPYVSLVSGSTVRSTLGQMMRKPDDPLTAVVAREVCERTNSQGFLSGNIARVGQHFLITEEANSCVDGSVVASARYEADKPEELPGGIDKIAASLRQKLGESRRSIARFTTPLVQLNTSSLEALKDYTRASLFMSQGKVPEAIGLYKTALSLDSSFAAAQYDLAAAYLSSGDFQTGREEIRKAYLLRSVANEPVRLAIVAAYEGYYTQNLFEADRNYRSWTEMYPRSAQAWNGLSNTERDLGHHAESAAAGLKVVALVPTYEGMYVNAAYEQMRAGDTRGAIATLDSAVAHHLEGDRVHEMYLHAAHLNQDPVLLKTQLAWIDAHPDAAYSRLQLAGIAMGEGRFIEGRRMLGEVTALLRRQGLSGFADSITKISTQNLLQAGDREEAIRLFRSVPLDPEDGDDLEILAMIGDSKTAEADLKAERARHPEGTMWQYYWGPRVEALIALSSHDPQKAIALLEVERPLDGRVLDTHMLRGDAYLAAGQPSLAEKEYREAVTHRERDSAAPAYALSLLGLGRALAAEGKTKDAADAYRQFLTLWARADPDAIFLQQAKQEFAKLQGPAQVGPAKTF